MKIKKLLTSVTLTLGVGAILFGFWRYELPPFHDIALRVDDMNYNFNRHKPDPSIVFVAIDERSVNVLGRWPWDRTIIAQGLKPLASAKAVLFDMVFSETTNTTSDENLAQAIGEIPSICGFFLRHKATQELDNDQKDLMLDSSISPLSGRNFAFVEGRHVEANIPILFEHCTLQAPFSTIRDSDNLFRHYPLGFIYDHALYPSLGLQGLRLVLHKDITKASEQSIALDGREIRSNSKGFTRLNYYPLESYEKITISFLDLYEGRVDQSQLEDKIVILGITEAGVEDVRATPIGALPGPMLHYTFLSNFLQGHLLDYSHNLALAVAVLFLLIPILCFAFIKKVLIRGVIYGTGLVLFIIASKALYIWGDFWVESFYPILALLGSVLVNESLAFTMQEKEAKFIQSAFSSYLSPMLLSKLKAHPESLTLGGENRELTIFFSDIRSFTSISESMTPEALVRLLNRYFTPMAHIVREHEGMLDKYIGDAIMAFFNAPIDVKDHANKACMAAIEMIQRLELLNKELTAEGFAPLAIGIGLNTAMVTVGNMGSDDRFNYTAIGDGVNLASRVEGLNKNYRTQILITEFTYKQLTQPFLCRRLEAVKVKGKDEAIFLYELMLPTQENNAKKEAFEKILELYEAHDFQAAQLGFEKLYKENGDEVAKLFYEKSAENIKRMANHEEISFTAFKTK